MSTNPTADNKATDASLSITGVTAGSLTTCQYCGATLDLVDGTDADAKGPRGEWREVYRCPNDHRGEYRYRDADGKERFRGACAERGY